MCEFSKNFKSLRLKNKFTIRHIAQILNVSTSSIVAWEKGRRKPKLNTLIKIVKLFNVSCKDILGI